MNGVRGQATDGEETAVHVALGMYVWKIGSSTDQYKRQMIPQKHSLGDRSATPRKRLHRQPTNI